MSSLGAGKIIMLLSFVVGTIIAMPYLINTFRSTIVPMGNSTYSASFDRMAYNYWILFPLAGAVIGLILILRGRGNE